MPEKAAPLGARPTARLVRPTRVWVRTTQASTARTSATTYPRWRRDPPTIRGVLPPSPDRGGLGELVGGVAPRAVEQPLEQEQGDRVEQQGCHDLVDAAADPQHGGDEPPRRARDGAGDQTERQRHRISGSAGKARVTAVTAIAPAMNCPSPPIAVVAGPEGDQRGQPGEDQWRARQEYLKHGV